jgi:hypothetical protein
MDSPTPTGVGPQIRVPRLRETLFGFQALSSFFLLSATYQPLPLNTMPAGWMSRRTRPSHSGQRVSGLAEKLYPVKADAALAPVGIGHHLSRAA